MDHAAVAAKRYRKFKAQKRNDSIKKAIISFLFKLFELGLRALRKARILRRRKVETVKVESA